MSDIANESRREFLARITSNLNASVAEIPTPEPDLDAPKYHFPPGQGIRSLPGHGGDLFHVAFGGVR